MSRPMMLTRLIISVMLALLIPISAYAQESQKQQKRRQAPRRPSARKAYVDHIRDTFRRTDERHGPVDHLNAGWGGTSLMIGANNGHTDTIKALLAKGAKVNAKDKRGWTALMGATQADHTEIVELLKTAGTKK